MSETDLEPAGTGLLRDTVLALGVPLDEVEQAEADGTLALLALERAVATETPTLDLREVAVRSGVDARQIRAFWRALGFPDPRPASASSPRPTSRC